MDDIFYELGFALDDAKTRAELRRVLDSYCDEHPALADDLVEFAIFWTLDACLQETFPPK